jgi:hypothetical protein
VRTELHIEKKPPLGRLSPKNLHVRGGHTNARKASQGICRTGQPQSIQSNSFPGAPLDGDAQGGSATGELDRRFSSQLALHDRFNIPLTTKQSGCAEKVQRFQKVRFAMTIRADQNIEPRNQGRGQVLVVSEVIQVQGGHSGVKPDIHTLPL